MGILDKLIGGSVAEPVEAVGNVLDKLFTSDAERLDKKIIMERLKQQPGLAQVELNKVEAQHRSPYVAGWRPTIGYVCAGGLAIVFIVNPLMGWATNRVGPDMPLDAMIELVIAMLGLGALRTVEKLKGRAK